jgi:hypothetical protein
MKEPPFVENETILLKTDSNKTSGSAPLSAQLSPPFVTWLRVFRVSLKFNDLNLMPAKPAIILPGRHVGKKFNKIIPAC